MRHIRRNLPAAGVEDAKRQETDEEENMGLLMI